MKKLKGKRERRREKEVLGKEGIFGSGHVTGHGGVEVLRNRFGRRRGCPRRK
jgi:hypothetical protein